MKAIDLEVKRICEEKLANDAKLLNNTCYLLLDARVLLYFSFCRQPEHFRSTALTLPAGHPASLRLDDDRADRPDIYICLDRSL